MRIGLTELILIIVAFYLCFMSSKGSAEAVGVTIGKFLKRLKKIAEDVSSEVKDVSEPISEIKKDVEDTVSTLKDSVSSSVDDEIK